MFNLNYNYASCIANSEKVAWKLDDVMPHGTDLDFRHPFLPEELVSTRSLRFLNDYERLKLNQIFGNSYLNLFAFVEEYILATVMQHANAEMFSDRVAVRALCRFADEEAKHQQLFHRYRDAFDRGFGHPCGVLESAVAVAEIILEKSSLAVMVLTLHLELMTQAHYIECIKDNSHIDPFFANLLKYHWMEEAQHAKLDTLQLEKLATECTREQVDGALHEYLQTVQAFDGLLSQQVRMDVDSLATVTGRGFSDSETAQIRSSLTASYRKTFLTSGMSNPGFNKILGIMYKDGPARIAAELPAYQKLAA